MTLDERNQEIYDRHLNGEPMRKIANRYGITAARVQQIVKELASRDVKGARLCDAAQVIKFKACCRNLRTAVRRRDIYIGRFASVDPGIMFGLRTFESDVIVSILYCPFCGKRLPEKEQE